MKKSFRTFVTSTILSLAVCFNLAAVNSASYEATAFTILDEAYSLMNVLDWKNLKFSSLYYFSNINSSGSGNLTVAFYTKKKNTVALGWEGSLWDNASLNNFSFFYGWDKFAVAADFTEHVNSVWYLDGNICSNYKEFAGKVDFGYVINKKFSTSLSFGYSNIAGTITNTKINYSIFAPNLVLLYNLKEDKKSKSSMAIEYEGKFSLRTQTVGKKITETNYSQNKLTTSYKYNYSLSPKITYGFTGTIPCTLTLGDNIPRQIIIDFALSNGLSFVLNPDKLILNTGLKITLPTITFTESQSMQTDSFYTNLYLGLSLIINPSLTLDLVTGIDPIYGLSPQNLFNQAFKITIKGKM